MLLVVFRWDRNYWTPNFYSIDMTNFCFQRIVFQFRFCLTTNAKKPEKLWKVLVINYTKKTTTSSSSIHQHHLVSPLHLHGIDFFDEIENENKMKEMRTSVVNRISFPCSLPLRVYLVELWIKKVEKL